MLHDHHVLLDRAINFLRGPIVTREDHKYALRNLEELRRRTLKYRKNAEGRSDGRRTRHKTEQIS